MAVLLACSGEPTEPSQRSSNNTSGTPGPVAAVTVTPSNTSVGRGRSVQLSAAARDAQGRLVMDATISWRSSDPGIVSVNAAGLAVGITEGSALVTAMSGTFSGSARIIVSGDPVASIDLTPDTVDMFVRQTAVIVPTLRDPAGRLLSGRAIVWSTSDTAIATVSASGTITSVAPGTATITASSESQSASVHVTVRPIPVAAVQLNTGAVNLNISQTTQLSATTRDAQGNTLTGRTVTWSSNNTSVATVSPTGVVTAIGFGTAAVTATSEGVSASASVNVVPAGTPTASVSPTTASVIAGRTTTLTAQLRDAQGNVIPNVVFSWSSSNTAVAGISSSGIVSGLQPGTTTITASAQGVSASANITVTPVPVASVSVVPSPLALAVGQSAQIGATARDADGNVLHGRTVTWSSTEPSVVSVTSAGVVTALAGGSAVVRATVDGVVGSTSVTVTASVVSVQLTPSTVNVTVGGSAPLSATLRDANGNVLSGRAVSWSTSNASVASISSSSGSSITVGGAALGTATITAVSEGRSATATVNVGVAGDPTPSITPPSATMPAGSSTTLTAEMRDGNGAIVTGVTFTWASTNTSVATVTQSGVVTGTAPGSATITASALGKTASAPVTVTVPPIASVVVTPASVSVAAGGTQQFTASPRDANGNVLTGRTCSWSTSAAAIATVHSTTGVATAVAPGTTAITATCESAHGNGFITVTPAPVASVTVTPSSAGLTVGQSVTLAATPRDANGNPLSGRTVTWSSSNTAVATVSSTGLVTAAGVGTVTISATSEGQTGTATVTVSQVPVASVSVSPSVASLIVGQSTTLTATPRDANGNPLTGRTVTWSSANTAIATVSPSGVVTAVAQGSVTITATSEGRSGTSQIGVSPVPIASVTVTPNPAGVEVGLTLQLTATPRDAGGAVLTGRSCTWASSNSQVAGVSPTGGLASGFASGLVTITATCEGVSGTTSLNVTPPPVASVTLSPTSATIATGGSQTITATLRDARGNVLTGRAITWSSSNTGVATVSSGGVVSGVSVGSATVTATSEGVSGTSAITVTAPTVATVSVTPSSASLAPGETVQLSATARDANGNTITGRTVAWSISDSTIARISAAGLVTAVAAGTVIATARVDGVNGTSQVTVTSTTGGGGTGSGPTVASVDVTPSSASLTAGAAQQFAATARDANGQVVLNQSFTWSSSNPNVLTVTQSGVATAVAAGTAQVRATTSNVTGTANVTVAAPSTGFVAPDILVKDFEDGAWGVMAQPLGAPGSRHQIVTDAANCNGGSRCYRYTIPSSAEYSVNQFYINGGQGYQSIYYRVDIRITAPVMGQLKGLRFVTSASEDAGGTFVRELGTGFSFGNDASNVEFALGIWNGARDPNFHSRGYRTYVENMTTTGYHRLVMHYERNSSVGLRARFWINGVPIVQPAGPAWAINGYLYGRSQGGADWVNGNTGEPSWLVAGPSGSTSPLSQLRIFDQLSHTYGASNGFIYLDNLMLSTQPIQP